MKKLGTWLLMFAFSGPLTAGTVGLVGSSYGKIECAAISRTVLAGNDPYDYVQCGIWLEPADFFQFSLVVLASSIERPYTDEEQQAIGRYVEGGGNILLIQNAPNSVADKESQGAFTAWSGISRSVFYPNGAPAELMVEDDPLLKGVWEKGVPAPLWANAGMIAVCASSDVQVLIGTAEGVLLARRPLGKGMVYYVGHESFRLRNKTHPAYAESESWITLVRNIVEAAAGNTLAESRREEFKSSRAAGGRSFMLWTRPWQRGEEKEPIFVPALPRPKEMLFGIRGDLALNESEFFQVNLTAVGAGGRVSVELKAPSLPADALRLFVQDAPPPIPWPKNPAIARESPYWMMPPEALEPKGSPDFLIGPDQTRILWLQVNTAGANPGRHGGEVVLKVDGKGVASIPLEWNVHPVRVPDKRLITLMPYGHVYGDVGKPAEAMRFKRNLEENGFEWSLINAVEPGKFKLPGGHALSTENLPDVAMELREGREPELDLSALDPFVEAAIGHNLTKFTLTSSLTTGIDGLLKKCALDDSDRDAVSQWYFRQVLAYFNDHGIRDVYARFGDEMTAKMLREDFLPWARRIQRAGWLSASSFTGYSNLEPDLNTGLSEVVGSWTLNRTLAPHFLEAVGRRELQTLPEARVGAYGAGGGIGFEMRRNLFESRQAGWEAWALGYDHVAPNPYFKGWLYYVDYRGDHGVAGERFVSYLDKDDLDAPLLNSPWLVGIRESMEEANLAAILNWYLERLEKFGPGEKAEAESLRVRAQAIVGEGPAAPRTINGLMPVAYPATENKPSSPIYWRRYSYRGMENNRVITGDLSGYLEAKRRILELLDEVRPLVAGRVGADLFWNRVPLVLAGKPVAAVIGGAMMVDKVQASCLAESGVELLQGGKLASPLDGMRCVILVGPADAPEFRDILAAGNIRAPLSRAGWIKDWTPEGSNCRVIWIGGRTSADIDRTLGKFSAFLRAEGNWFAG